MMHFSFKTKMNQPSTQILLNKKYVLILNVFCSSLYLLP